MAEPKNVIYGVAIHDDKGKKKVIKAISSIKGVESVAVDLNEQKLTVVGIFDPIRGYDKLKKVCVTKLLFLEIVKKEEPKKEEPKKDEPKKDEDEKNKMWTWEPHFNPYFPERYCVIMEENPKSCVIS